MKHLVTLCAFAAASMLCACSGGIGADEVAAHDATDTITLGDARDTWSSADTAMDAVGDDTAVDDALAVDAVDAPMPDVALDSPADVAADAGTGSIMDRLRITPYVPLASIGQNQDAVALAINRGDPGSPSAADIARWFRYYDDRGQSLSSTSTAGGQTLGQRLLAAGMHLSQYINGSYSGSDDLTEIETSVPLGISTYWCGQPNSTTGTATSTACRLPSALTASATTFIVSLPTGAAVPAGASANYPFRASTTSAPNGHSVDGRTFVSFLRIDDELLEIRAVGARGGTSNAPTLTLTVVRGLWGTSAVAHASASRVQLPVYIGGSTGLGAARSCPDPTGNNDIRYALRINQGSSFPRGDVLGHLIQRVGGHGWTSYDSIFLDCSSPSFFNETDAYCLADIEPWNDRSAANPHLTTQAENGVDQDAKFAALRTALPNIRDVANNWNINSRSDFDIRIAGIRAGSADGYVFEAWNDGLGRNAYAATLDAHLIVQNEGLHGVYLQKTSARDTSTWPTDAQFARWIYGNYLLAYHVASPSTDPRALPPLLMLDIGLAQPDGLYFWDLGAPSATPSAIPAAGASDGGLAQPSASVYTRTFANGFVVVNASASATTVPLSGVFYDVTASASAPPRVMGGSVTVPSHDARVLVSR